ncbi:MAG: hypothetical protein Q4B47_06835 [Eubacteriales bacterium]|nr:hypothetical protein [Eubacteriales bacterium]
MIEFTIEIADFRFRIQTFYEYAKNKCVDYITNETPDYYIKMNSERIHFERSKAQNLIDSGKLTGIWASDEHFEFLAIYRCICEILIDHNTIAFHGTAVSVDGKAYLIAASSGVGKSTHARLWKQLFGTRAQIINDDKPLLKITNEGVWVYGSPWSGKDDLNTNVYVPLSAMGFLKRAVSNEVKPMNEGEAFTCMVHQIYHSEYFTGTKKILQLVLDLCRQVSCYEIYANMNPGAAALAYNTMKHNMR